MSKVKIQGNASGSGVFTLTTPNTSTDRTITLPDASGTLAFTTDDDDKLPLAGGAMTGAITTNSTFDGIDVAAAGALAANSVQKSGGSVITSNLDFNDGVIAKFGTGGDLQIFHDGTVDRLNSGSARFVILATQLEINNAAGSEAIAKFVQDGGVELNHNNVKKFETTSTGTTVTRGKFTDGIEIIDGSTEDCLKITASSSDHNLARWEGSNSSADQQSIMQFYRNGGLRGSISTSNSATAFNTSSDYRLKENVDYTWDATTRLKQLKPARFNWIEDETNTLVDGFIAHEVTSVVPEAVCGAKDAVDSDSNPEYQGIDQSKLVPLLVKTIQELEARITALEA